MAGKGAIRLFVSFISFIFFIPCGGTVEMKEMNFPLTRSVPDQSRAEFLDNARCPPYL
jgi:hypothetical protein